MQPVRVGSMLDDVFGYETFGCGRTRQTLWIPRPAGEGYFREFLVTTEAEDKVRVEQRVTSLAGCTFKLALVSCHLPPTDYVHIYYK